jgi:hypothetical protein
MKLALCIVGIIPSNAVLATLMSSVSTLVLGRAYVQACSTTLCGVAFRAFQYTEQSVLLINEVTSAEWYVMFTQTLLDSALKLCDGCVLRKTASMTRADQHMSMDRLWFPNSKGYQGYQMSPHPTAE